MNLFWALVILVIAIFVLVYAIIKLAENVINVLALLSTKNKLDITKQRHGIVVNTSDGTVEADQTVITPF